MQTQKKDKYDIEIPFRRMCPSVFSSLIPNE
jgi:hypothetical protein